MKEERKSYCQRTISRTLTYLTRESVLMEHTPCSRRAGIVPGIACRTILNPVSRGGAKSPGFDCEAGDFRATGDLFAAAEINSRVVLRQLSAADEERMQSLVLNAEAMSKNSALRDRETDKNVFLSLPLAMEIIQQTPIGIAALERYDLVTLPQTRSFMETIEAYQTAPEYVAALTSIAGDLIKAGLNFSLTDPTEIIDTKEDFAVILHSPAYRGFIGGYLLWSENRGRPDLLLQKAEQGLLPPEVAQFPDMIRTAEALYRINPKFGELAPGFLSGALEEVLGGATAQPFINLMIEANLRQLQSTVEGKEPGITRQILSGVATAARVATLGLGQVSGVIPQNPGATEDVSAARGIGITADATELGGTIDEVAHVSEVVSAISKVPGDTLSMQQDWADRVRYPPRFRAWAITQIEEAFTRGDIDENERSRRLGLVNNAKDAELAAQAQKIRFLTLEGINQGIRVGPGASEKPGFVGPPAPEAEGPPETEVEPNAPPQPGA